MDLLQDQVSALNMKVDALHKTLEQVESRTAEMLSSVKHLSTQHLEAGSPIQPDMTRPDLLSGRPTYHSYQTQTLIDSEMEHKDILSDVTYPDPDSHGSDRGITPEIQIQRLTAQLTAAYNRIAALEEQLIAKRFV
jgi:uncharacterized coiled-coil protein SlyX